MPKLRVHSFAMSVDGFVAGPNQDLDHPLGVGGEQLHTWAFGDRHPVDDYFFARGDIGIGATVMGRNMFGPIRGEWGDSDWTGWWGPEPPYHHPVFVVTHHAHDPIEMKGGTTFTFVTDGIESALAQSFAAADGQDVRLGGGASTVRQCLELDLVDDCTLPSRRSCSGAASASSTAWTSPIATSAPRSPAPPSSPTSSSPASPASDLSRKSVVPLGERWASLARTQDEGLPQRMRGRGRRSGAQSRRGCRMTCDSGH